MADYSLIEGALQRGYSMDEIADKLAQAEGFDPSVIRSRGYGAEEIIGRLGYAKPEEVKPEGSGLLRRAGDYGLSAIKSAIAVPEIAVGLADIATGGQVGKAAEGVGFKPKEAKEILDSYLSPEQQAANKAVHESEGFMPTIKAAIEHPSTIAHSVVESVGPMLAGGVAGRGLLAVAPKLAGGATTAAAIGEGIAGAGSAAEQIRQNSNNGELSANQSGMALASGVGTAAFGFAGGRLAQKLGINDVDTMLVKAGSQYTSKGVVRRIVEGGISEGVFEELPQSTQEQIWQNAALDRPLMDGVENSAAMGMLAGVAMGGAGGFVPSGAKPTPPATVTPSPSITSAPTTDDAIKAFQDEVASVTPRGSFGSMDDLVDLIESERSDLGKRRGLLAQQQQDARDMVAEFSGLVKDEQIDQSYRLNDAQKQRDAERTRDGGYDLALQQREEQQGRTVEQLEAASEAQGFGNEEPTAMQLAMQQAQQKALDNEFSGLLKQERASLNEMRANVKRVAGVPVEQISTPQLEEIAQSEAHPNTKMAAVAALNDRHDAIQQERERLMQLRETRLEKQSNQPEQGAQHGTKSHETDGQVATPSVAGGGANVSGGGFDAAMVAADRGMQGTASAGAAVSSGVQVGAVPVADQPTNVRALTENAAKRQATQLTNQGFPTVAYPHPTQPGMWAIGSHAEAKSAPAKEQQAQQAQHAPVEPAADDVPVINVRQHTTRRKPASNTIAQAIINLGGISTSLKQDITGDASVRSRPGLFTKNGTADLSELAARLSGEFGFTQIDVNDPTDNSGAKQLADLIASSVNGETILNEEAMIRAQQDEEFEQAKAEVNLQAQEIGIKPIRGKRTIDVVQAEINAILAEREARNAQARKAAAIADEIAEQELIDEFNLKVQEYHDENAIAKNDRATESARLSAEESAQGDGDSVDQASPVAGRASPTEGGRGEAEVTPEFGLVGQTEEEAIAEEQARRDVGHHNLHSIHAVLLRAVESIIPDMQRFERVFGKSQWAGYAKKLINSNDVLKGFLSQTVVGDAAKFKIALAKAADSKALEAIADRLRRAMPQPEAKEIGDFGEKIGAAREGQGANPARKMDEAARQAANISDDHANIPNMDGVRAAAQQILDAIEQDDLADYGLRVIPGEFEGDIAVGDVLPPSRVWEDGRETDDELLGTSTVEVGSLTLDGILKSLNGLGAAGKPGPNGYYFGDRVVLVKGDRVSGGDDSGESLLKNASVVGVWRKASKGLSSILPNEAVAPKESGANTLDPIAAVKATLDAAGVTGTDRTSTIAAVRRGDLTAEDVAAKETDAGVAMFSRGRGNLRSRPRGEITHETQRLEKEINRDLARQGKEAIGAAGFITRSAVPDNAHRLVKAVEKLFGVRVEFVQVEDERANIFNGVFLGGNTLFVNVDSSSPISTVIGHEFLHFLKESNHDIYAKVEKDLLALANARKFAAAAIKHQPAMNAGEEVIADTFGDQFSNPEFWEELANRLAPSLFMRVRAAFTRFLGKLLGEIKAMGATHKTDTLYSDLTAVRDAVLSATVGAANGRKLATPEWRSLHARFMTAWHGSPHDHDGFDSSKIGTGEGAQAYGSGLYFSSVREIAEHYRNSLSDGVRGGLGLAGVMPSATDKRLSHGEWIAAKELSELLVSKSNVVQPFSKLDVVSKGRVLSVVNRLIQDFEVRNTVVGFIPIDVVNMLGGKQLSSDDLLHDPSVLINLLPVNANDLVPGSIDSVDVLTAAVALAAAKVHTGLVRFDVSPSDFLAASGAIRHGVSPDILSKIPHPNEFVKGRLYQVELAPAEDEYLDWDKPLSEQGEKIKAALDGVEFKYKINDSTKGEDIYLNIALDDSRGFENTGYKAASEYLHSIGIRGIKYLDGSSRPSIWKYDVDVFGSSGSLLKQHRVRTKAEADDIVADAEASGRAAKVKQIQQPDDQNHNYVIFDDADVKITAKESRRASNDLDFTQSQGSEPLRKTSFGYANDTHNLFHATTINSSEGDIHVFHAHDPVTGELIGSLGLGLNGDEITVLYNIKDETNSGGFGEKILRSLLAGSKDGLYIVNMLPDAVGFWKKMGVSLDDHLNGAWEHGNGILTEQALTTARGEQSGARESKARYEQAFSGGGGSEKGGETNKTIPSGRVTNETTPANAGVSVSAPTESVRRIQAVVERFKSQFKGASALDIRVVSTTFDIPARFRPSPFAEGVFHDDAGLVYLVTMNLHNPRGELSENRAWQVLLHESVGHYGLSQMMGDKFASILKAVKQATLAGRKVSETQSNPLQPGDKDYTTWEAVQLRYPDATDAEVAQEVLARMSETDSGSSVLGYAVAVVRQWVRDVARAMGVNVMVSTSELRDLVAKASGYMRRGDNLAEERVPSGLVAASTGVAREGGKRGLESRAATVQPQGPIWSAPEMSRTDNIIYTMQDKNIDLKRVQQAIKEAVGEIRDDIDTYLQEELFHGRAAKITEEFLDKEVNPLISLMRASNVSMEEMETFLWARHAKERNAQIAKINDEMPDGGSGLTNKQADDLMAGKDVTIGDKTIEGVKPNRKELLSNLAGRVDAITRGNRALREHYSLESADTLNAWDGAYKHYVPLHREDAESHLAGMGTGQGYSVKGSSSKRATGSSRPVENILANLALQRERIITRGEKNRVAQSLYGLAKEMPNADLWEVDVKPTMKTVAIIGGRDQVVDAVDPNFRNKPNVVFARFNGKDRFIVFNEHNERAVRMAQALKNLDADDISHLLGEVSRWTRYFASINTQYNPIFGVTNLVRDVQTGLLNLKSTPIEGKQKDLMGNLTHALPAVFKALRAGRKGQAATGTWAQLWEEFQEVGGQTGYRDMFRNGQERAEALQNALDPTWWQKTWWGKAATVGGVLAVPEQAFLDKFGKPFMELLSDYNTMMENGIRLAAYKVALDTGMTQARAASLAKNLTVNFNRKGQAARQVGAMYAFFNASIQGTARMAETLNHGAKPGELLGKAGKQIVYGGLLLGAVQAMLLMAAGFDDEEPPEFVRDRNIIIPTGNGKYVSIPMPLGFHVLPAISRISIEFTAGGFKKPGEHLVHIMDVLLDSFNPIGNAGLSMQTVAPTVLDPIAALTENKDWSGRQIARQDFSKLNPTPGYTRAKDTASSLSRGLAYAFNYLSGGGEYGIGIVSPTPDQIDYLLGQLTGGVGRELGKVLTTGEAMATGEDLPPHKIPLVGRFYGDTTGQSSEASKFYGTLEKLSEHRGTLDRMKDAHDVEAYREYAKEHPESRFYDRANKVQRELSSLRKLKRKMIERNADRAKVRQIEDRMRTLMTRFNQSVSEQKGEH